MRVLRGVRIGPPLEPGVFMGPLVSQRGAREARCAIARSPREAGGERLLAVDPGLPAALRRRRASSASTSPQQEHPYQRDEIFGPEAALYPVDDLDAGDRRRERLRLRARRVA